MTYGDGVADIDINELVKFHQEKGQLATLTAVHVGQRFGVLDIRSGKQRHQGFPRKIQCGRKQNQRRIYGIRTGSVRLYRRR